MPIINTALSGVYMGIADKDYFLDDKGNIADSEETAATLLIRAGQEVPKEMADQYGIGKVAQKGETDAADGADASTVNEKATKPTANKSKKPTENKGVK